MNEFFKMNPIAIIAMVLLVCGLIGSAEHTYTMVSEYFKISLIAGGVVFAMEVGVLVSAWQKGANVMTLKNSASLSVFNGVVIMNVFMANISQSFQAKYNIPFSFGAAWDLDAAAFMMWLFMGLAIPTLVLSMTHVISENFSKKAAKAYTDTLKQPKQDNEPTFDLENASVDELREQLQDHFDQHGINIKVTDDVLARHLGKTKRTIVRKRKEDREREEASQNITRVRVGTNGHYGVG